MELFLVVCFTEEFEVLKRVVLAIALRHPHNCDDIFNIGQRTDGVYEILVGSTIVQTFCEFDRDGYNWMVCWQKKMHLIYNTYVTLNTKYTYQTYEVIFFNYKHFFFAYS